MSLTHEEIVAELVAELEQRDADRKLLAEVLAWSRRNGYDKAREYEGGKFAGYAWKAPCQKLFFCPHFDPTLYWEGSAIQPGTIREAVDVLCALDVLPVTFSSAWRAGFDAMGDAVNESVVRPTLDDYYDTLKAPTSGMLGSWRRYGWLEGVRDVVNGVCLAIGSAEPLWEEIDTAARKAVSDANG